MKFLLSLIFITSISSTIYGQEVTIVTEDFPPFNYMENDVMKGMSTEVVLAVLEEVGVKPNIKLLPWARAYRIATTEKNHIIYSIVRDQDREELFHWIGAIASYHTSLYKLKAREDIEIKSLNDAKAYLIGCSRSDVITSHLKRNGFTRLDIVTTDVQNLHRLIRGRVDLIGYEEASFVQKVQQEGLDLSLYEKAYRVEDLSGDLYMAFSKSSDTTLVHKFQEGLQVIKERGVIKNIQTNYSF